MLGKIPEIVKLSPIPADLDRVNFNFILHSRQPPTHPASRPPRKVKISVHRKATSHKENHIGRRTRKKTTSQTDELQPNMIKFSREGNISLSYVVN